MSATVSGPGTCVEKCEKAKNINLTMTTKALLRQAIDQDQGQLNYCDSRKAQFHIAVVYCLYERGCNDNLFLFSEMAPTSSDCSDDVS